MEEPFKDLDQFTKKWMHDAPLQKPSAGFSKSVLSTIEKSKTEQAYVPLISKKAWSIGFGVTTLLILIYWFQPSEGAVYGTWLNSLSFLETIRLRDFGYFDVPKTALYGFAFLALFIIQIPLIKSRYNKTNP